MSQVEEARVEPGQVYEDRDRREGGRTVTVVALEGRRALCLSSSSKRKTWLLVDRLLCGRKYKPIRRADLGVHPGPLLPAAPPLVQRGDSVSPSSTAAKPQDGEEE